MRIVFAGTPEFSRRALLALIEAGHELSLVLTQPDRKSGRGLHNSTSPVKQLAIEHGLQLSQPASLKEPSALEEIRAAEANVFVVAAYGLILPKAALDATPNGALNIHASLLPRWRGAAPIQRALLAGDSSTGISIMQMDTGLDTGPVIERRTMPIAPDETAGSLHDKLAALGAEMIVRVLEQVEKGTVVASPQMQAEVTYAHKIQKREANLDWRESGGQLHRVVRAFNPVPGAHAVLAGTEIKIWQARPVDRHGDPGVVQSVGAEGVVVTCGAGAMILTELQRPGGKRLAVRDFLRGHPISPGTRFALPA